MTREEAIQILEVNKPVMTKRMSTPARKYVEAFEMAISALKGEWIPITYRPMTDEEKEHYSEQAGCDKEDFDAMLNCQLPEDGEEVLITVFGEVETDIFYRDVDECYFENRDISDVTAWMPKPEAYKSEKTETCKGCLEPCIMYEPDMRGCKKKVTKR